MGWADVFDIFKSVFADVLQKKQMFLQGVLTLVGRCPDHRQGTEIGGDDN